MHLGGGDQVSETFLFNTWQWTQFKLNDFKYNPVYFLRLQKSLWHQRSIVRQPKERPNITAPVTFCKAQHHCHCQIQSSRTVMQNEYSVSTTLRKRIYQISEYHLLKVRLHKMHVLQLMMSWTHHNLRASLKCPRLSA